MDGPKLDAVMPITLPQVDFITNPFGSITRGVIASIYTLWVMVGVRQGGLLVFCPSIVSELVALHYILINHQTTVFIDEGATTPRGGPRENGVMHDE